MVNDSIRFKIIVRSVSINPPLPVWVDSTSLQKSGDGVN